MSEFVFNPKRWIKDSVGELADETLLELDDRYINVGENVLDQNITNLNLEHLNMATNGYIYFNGDNTTQTTAYDPNFVTNQVNLFLTKNNTFTGTNRFRDLRVDTSTNKITEIKQEDDDFRIRNNQNGGVIYLTSRGGDGLYRGVMFRENNISNVGEISCAIARPQRVNFSGGTQSISTNTNNDLVITNPLSNKSIQLITRNLANTGDNTFVYNTDGNITGVNNLTLTTNLLTPKIQFPGTTASIYRSGLDIIIDNITTGGVKINGYRADGITTQVSIDQFANIGGVNDLFTSRVNLRKGTNQTSTVIQKSTDREFIIDNREADSQIYLQNYDSSGVMRRITINSTMSMSGVNDLYVQRIFLNGTQLTQTDTQALETNTRQIKSQNATQTTIEYNNGRFLFLPGALSTSGSSYNSIIKAGDNALIGYNIGLINNNTLTLCPWATTGAGIRLNTAQSELYKPKVMDSLTFADNTVQTTAMTVSYINSLIETAMRDMNINEPAGVVKAFLGITLPAGYLWCYGQQVSISTYQALFNQIGHTYARNNVIQPGQFYLPDLQGCFLKGIGANSLFVNNSAMISVGEIQQCNVGDHAHPYKDRGTGERDVSGAGTSKASRPTDDTFWTDGYAYHSSTRERLQAETRPNSIGVNYIIKF